MNKNILAKQLIGISIIFFLILSCKSSEKKSPQAARVKQETLFGRQIVKNFFVKYSLLKNEKETIAINQIIKKISHSSPRSDLIYRVGIIDSEEILAFAIPGGYILISKGMIKSWQSPEEAYFVLAHELSHIYHSHSYEPTPDNSFEKFLQTGLDPTGGAMLLVTSLEKKWLDLLEENGREPNQEFEADISAGYIMQEAECYPLSGISYLERLNKITQKTDWIQKTHPSFAQRIQLLKKEFKSSKKNIANNCSLNIDWNILKETFKNEKEK